MGKYRYNRYHDVEIDVARLNMASEQDAVAAVAEEEDKWEHRVGFKRGCESAVMWLRVPTELCRVLPWLVLPTALGGRPFVVHHAHSSHFMLVRPWRFQSQRHHARIPLYGTHYVRVECLVVEETSGHILMISERLGPQNSCMKFVTGSVDPGEFLSTASTREVHEETGVRASYVGVIGCGNRLRTRFDKDEILIGVLLKAPQGQAPRADGEEISKAQWLPAEEAYRQGSTMAREWLTAAGVSPNIAYGYLPDFRGPPHRMEFSAARQKDNGAP